jgi:nucleotide-binding universal stress UspA family protein
VQEPPPPTPRYLRVLAALDASEDAADVLAHAILVAQVHRARLTLLMIVPPPPAWAGARPEAAASIAPALEALFERELAHARDAVPEDVSVTTILDHGHPAARILANAREGGHDLVILGSRGHGGLRAAADSVSLKVLHHSPVPVLVVRVPHPPEEDEGAPARRSDPG